MQRGYESAKPEGILNFKNILPLNFIHKNGAEFCFQKRFERVEWKKIASVDITKLCQELDVETLQENICNVAFCDIESELDKPVDSNFIKLFKLAQLMIEYLLYSQEYLIGVVTMLEQRLHDVNQELASLKKERTEEQQIANNLQKENTKNKKIIIKQQHLFSGMIGSCIKCPFCSKAFINISFLKSHLTRRHPYQTSYPNIQDNVMVNNNKVEADTSFHTTSIETLKKELAEVKEILKSSDHITKEKMNWYEKVVNIDSIKTEIQMWKMDTEKQKKDLLVAQETFMSEIKDLHQKLQKYEEALTTLTHSYNMYQKCNLDSLTDGSFDTNTNYKLSSQEKEGIDKLRSELMNQIDAMKTMLQDEVMKQEVQWKDKIKELNAQHSNQLEKLHNELKNSSSHQLPKDTKEKRKDKLKNSISSFIHEQGNMKCQEQETNGIIAQYEITPSKKCSSAFVVNGCLQKKDILHKVSNLTKNDWQTSDRVASALKCSPSLLSGLHMELCRLVEDKLQKYGIKSSAANVTTELHCKLMNQLKNERTSLAKQYANYYEIRQSYSTFIDEISRKKLLKVTQNKSDQLDYPESQNSLASVSSLDSGEDSSI